MPKDREAKIFDIGCGYGKTLRKLEELGYTQLFGGDINNIAKYRIFRQIRRTVYLKNKKYIRMFTLKAYDFYIQKRNVLFANTFHNKTPGIYTSELKVIAKKVKIK